MDAVTYPQEDVAEVMEEIMVPVRVAPDNQQLAADFGVKWTPTLVVLDRNGQERHRTVGFLDPAGLKASLLFGAAKAHFENDDFEASLRVLDRLTGAFPKSGFAPEAIYLRGVAQYKSTHEARHLKAAYEQLLARYPENEWTMRAYPYRLL